MTDLIERLNAIDAHLREKTGQGLADLIDTLAVQTWGVSRTPPTTAPPAPAKPHEEAKTAPAHPAQTASTHPAQPAKK